MERGGERGEVGGGVKEGEGRRGRGKGKRQGEREVKCPNNRVQECSLSLSVTWSENF